MATRRTTIEIDDELLGKAQEVLGTTGLKGTVDAALDEVVRTHLRRRLAQRIKTGKGIDLSPSVLRASKEWRTR
jgi:Arc/MetJ family transcription regulator